MEESKMNARMTKFFEELHHAEFGNDELEIQEDPKEFIRLLKRAMTWETHENLILVCNYLGYEDDDRIETFEGCKEIIGQNIDYMRRNQG